MVETVVVAVDGGTASAAALDWAIWRAATVEVDARVTTVVDSRWSSRPVGGELYTAAHETALADAAHRLAIALPTHTIPKFMLHGVPADALVSVSNTADLLVIGSHTPSALAGMVHATLPLRVVGRAHCTTIVVPAGWTSRGTCVVVGWDNDGSSDAALAFAADEALRLGVELRIVHSWQVPAIVAFDAPGAGLLFDDVVDTQREALATTARAVRDSHPGLTVTEVLEPGPASVRLITEATGADLLVVGSHHRGALGGLVLGSVSHDCLMNMPAPVAVVPATRGSAPGAGDVTEPARSTDSSKAVP